MSTFWFPADPRWPRRSAALPAVRTTARAPYLVPTQDLAALPTHRFMRCSLWVMQNISADSGAGEGHRRELRKMVNLGGGRAGAGERLLDPATLCSLGDTLIFIGAEMLNLGSRSRGRNKWTAHSLSRS